MAAAAPRGMCAATASSYNHHVEQAHNGCDFDFLRGADPETLPEGLFDGWVGGW